MVGDYDESAPLGESVQLREVDTVARLGSLLALALLNEPVTFPGFVPAALSGEEQAPDAGSNLTFVGYSGDFLPIKLNEATNATAEGWPGPALEATLQAASEQLCALATQADSWVVLCGLPRVEEPAFPCRGEWGLNPFRSVRSTAPTCACPTRSASRSHRTLLACLLTLCLVLSRSAPMTIPARSARRTVSVGG